MFFGKLFCSSGYSQAQLATEALFSQGFSSLGLDDWISHLLSGDKHLRGFSMLTTPELLSNTHTLSEKDTLRNPIASYM